jgi:hypothetical protein
MVYSELQWRLYSTMVSNPDNEWTAQSLAAGLRWAADDDQDALEAKSRAVHDVVTTLLGDQWVEPVPYQRQLTVRLTAPGLTRLQLLLASWPAEATEGDKNA